MSASDEIARLRELRAKVTAGPWAIAGQRAEWATIITGKDGEAKIDARHPEDAAAIVAAMNSLESLLACAEALEKIARSPTGGVGCNPAEFVKDARAALDALARGAA